MNEFDRIRESLAKMRAYGKPTATNKPRRLNEDITDPNNQEFNTQKEAFQQAVPGEVEFGNCQLDNKEEIIIRGEMKIGLNGQPLRFLFTTKNKDGIYLECTQFQPDGDAIDSITKLRAYYDIWYAQNLQKLNGSTTNTGGATDAAGTSAPAGGMDGGMGGGAAPALPPM